MELLKLVREENATAHTEIKDLLTLQNGRIKTLELWRERIRGMTVAVAAGSAIIVTVLSQVVGWVLTKLV